MIAYTLTEIFYSDLQEIRFYCFFMPSVLSQCYNGQPLPQDLEISSFKPSKPPLMFLMMISNGGNKLFLMCKSVSGEDSIANSQNQETLFHRDSLSFDKAMSKKIHLIVMFIYQT